MSQCRACGGSMTVQPSVFPGFDLLICNQCERPIRLIVTNGPRPSGGRPLSRADMNRVLRSARRMKMKGKHGTDLP